MCNETNEERNPKSPWISVKDDLPCNHKELIRKTDIFKPETVEVLVKINLRVNCTALFNDILYGCSEVHQRISDCTGLILDNIST